MKKPWLAQISAGVMLTIATASAQSTTARVTKDVRFTMDDGIQIAADVYLPPSGSGPFPCLVELTPYRKETRAAEGASFLPGQGFALIEADARGTGGSNGEYRTRRGNDAPGLATTLAVSRSIESYIPVLRN